MNRQNAEESQRASERQEADSLLVPNATESVRSEQVEETPAQAGVQPPSPFHALLAAFQFLLITPAFIRRPFTPHEMGKSVGFYPLVGAVLGGILLGFNWLLGHAGADGAPVFPVQIRAVLILALWIVLTGALHLDGFLDACDGLLGGYTPEQRLKIMRDERVGAYALAGGILLLLVKFSALCALVDRPMALLLTPVLGRWSMAVAVVAFPYARSQGLGRDVKDHATWRQVFLASVLGLAMVILAIWLSRSWVTLAALVASALTVWGGVSFALRRVPGLTGDVYGALNELVEMVVLLVLAAGLS